MGYGELSVVRRDSVTCQHDKILHCYFVTDGNFIVRLFVPLIFYSAEQQSNEADKAELCIW